MAQTRAIREEENQNEDAMISHQGVWMTRRQIETLTTGDYGHGIFLVIYRV
jgi:hypothetical protein